MSRQENTSSRGSRSFTRSRTAGGSNSAADRTDRSKRRRPLRRTAGPFSLLGRTSDRDSLRRSENRLRRFERLERREMLHGEGLPEYDPDSAFHIHADLNIFINGQKVTIPQGVGDSVGRGIHTHDNTNRLHIHPNEPDGDFITLGDWFDVWKADTTLGDPAAFLSSTRLMNNTVDSTHVLRMFVNGEPSTEFANYKIHDGDSISLAYTSNPIVMFETNAGPIPMELLPGETPNTVANFRSYFAQYPGTIFHRAAESSPGVDFVVQGGGFAPTNKMTTSLSAIQSAAITTHAPIGNEPNRSNTVGTIAMAKSSGPVSTTSQWFVNMKDNSFLDSQNFTVFALTLDMTTPKKIAALTFQDLDPSVPNSVFDNVPYTAEGELVFVESVTGDGLVRGAVFNDADRDGVRDTGEGGIANLTVFDDANQNGQLDTTETRTTTAADGTYAFRLPSGSHRVRVVANSPLSRTFPTGADFQTVNVEVAGEHNNINFGFAKLAANDTFTVAEDSVGSSAANAFEVLNNDTTAGSPTVTGVSGFSRGGSATIDNNRVRYTPAANFNGVETFNYTIRDSQNVTDTAVVTVTVTSVNDPPTAGDDSFQVVKGVAKSLDVLTNDSIAPDTGETLTITLGSSTTPGGGTIALSNDGRQVVYTPTASFVGSDSFTYTVNDGRGGTDQAIVSLTVQDFVPRSIRGRLEQSESSAMPIGGLPIMLTGVNSLGQNVNRMTHTEPDGTYEFAGLAPGEYEVTKPVAPFLEKVAANHDVMSAAQDGNSTGIDFAAAGRRGEFIDIRDFLGSTPRQFVLAAIGPNGATHWYQFGTGWTGASDVSVQLSADESTVTINVDDGAAKTATISARSRRNVEFLGEENGAMLVRIRGSLSSLPFQPAGSTAPSTTPSGEGPDDVSHAHSSAPDSLGRASGEGPDTPHVWSALQLPESEWRRNVDAFFGDDELIGGALGGP